MSFPTVISRAIKRQRIRELSTTCYCQTPCKPGGLSSPSLGARAESTKPQGARVGQRSRTQSMPDIAPKLRGATNEMMWYLQRDSKWQPQESKGLTLLDRVDRPVRGVKSGNRGVNRRESSWERPEGKPRAVVGMSPSWEERAKGKRVVFIGIDMNTALPKIFATKTPVYRSSGLSIRAFPAHLLPPRPAPPFPLDLISKTRRENPCVYLSIITSKNQVSKLAVERNRVRRRLKAAWDRVINGGSEGWRLVSPDYAYVVSVNGELHDAEFESIVQEVATGLRFLQQRRPKEMSRQNGSGMVPESKYISRIKLQTEGMGREIPGGV
ncbi:ribonuclease P protein component [Cryptococcus decagattii]|uniref:Ribonuclease P protein component n=1 Tax=Cryptococcus decagattii TaxID=1859122 RepID=A0ABZ2AV74_9TREE